LARDARIPAIAVESGQIALRPPWLKDLGAAEVAALRRQLHQNARVGRREIWLPLSWEADRWLDNLSDVLQTLGDWWRQKVTA